MRKIIWLCLLLLFSSQVFAQQHIKEQIKNLDKDFRSFKYKRVIEKGRFLLSDPYVTKEDSLNIYKYMLNAAYALADTVEAKKIIKEIIKCDPEFALNPKDTSPKIIEFFNHVKKQIQQHQPLVPNTTLPSTHPPVVYMPVYKPLPFRSMVLSFLLPGSGHLHQKFRKRGLRFSGVSFGLLGGIVYTTLQTQHKRDVYMRATGEADFDRLYNDYNRIYKIRNALIAAFVLWDVYALFDLQKQWQVSLQTNSNGHAVSLRISKSW